MSFESKYVAEAARVPALLARLGARCLADPEHPTDRIHSVYFDPPDLPAMREVDHGDFYKTKVRVRWYEDDRGRRSEAFLECKRKFGARRAKVRLRLDAIDLDLPLQHPRWLGVPQQLARTGSPPPAGLWQPTLHISYLRHRFVDPLSDLRVAVDHQIRACRVHPRFASAAALLDRPDRLAVFEAKGAHRDLPAGFAFVRDLGFRRSAFSKYGLWNEILN